jgi:hypothetical protein
MAEALRQTDRASSGRNDLTMVSLDLNDSGFLDGALLPCRRSHCAVGPNQDAVLTAKAD